MIFSLQALWIRSVGALQLWRNSRSFFFPGFTARYEPWPLLRFFASYPVSDFQFLHPIFSISPPSHLLFNWPRPLCPSGFPNIFWGISELLIRATCPSHISLTDCIIPLTDGSLFNQFRCYYLLLQLPLSQTRPITLRSTTSHYRDRNQPDNTHVRRRLAQWVSRRASWRVSSVCLLLVWPRQAGYDSCIFFRQR